MADRSNLADFDYAPGAGAVFVWFVHDITTFNLKVQVFDTGACACSMRWPSLTLNAASWTT